MKTSASILPIPVLLHSLPRNVYSGANKTEDPSVPYAGQDYIRVLNVFEITKPLKEQNNTKRNPNVP